MLTACILQMCPCLYKIKVDNMGLVVLICDLLAQSHAVLHGYNTSYLISWWTTSAIVTTCLYIAIQYLKLVFYNMIRTCSDQCSLPCAMVF